MRTRWDTMPRRVLRPGMLAGGDGSTLSLDFTTMSSLDPRFTFTRASTATYINSSGYVTTMAAASTNDPTKARFDYDPTTLAPRGLLIEASATNICTWSQDFSNANWLLDNGSATNPAVSVVSQTAPDGASSVNRITFNKTGGTFSRIRQTLSGTATATYTFSVWLKANTASGGAATQNVGLRIGVDPAGFNCVVTTTWKRFSYSYALSGTDASAQIMLWDNIVGNDETADVLVWGAQLEAGSGASSYVASGASQGQRAADSCSMTGTNFSSWFNTIGTFVVEQELSGPFITSDRVGIGLGTYSSGTSSFGFFRNNTTTVGTAIWGSGGTGYQENTISVATRSLARSGFTLDWSGATRSNRSFANGTVAASLVSTTGSITVDRMFIGANSATGTSASRDWINGHMRSIKFWPTVLPNATLQSLTQ